MLLSLEQHAAIYNDLVGTTKSLAAVLEALELPTELAVDDYLFIDERAFECIRCGWWHEISDMHEDADDEWYCRDCGEDEE